MFKFIKTNDFFFFACPQTMELFNQGKSDYHTNCNPCKDCSFAKNLYAQVVESAAVEQTAFNIEQTVCNCSPYTVGKVNAYGTNRVINVELEVKAFYNYYNKNTCNNTDN